MNKINNILLVEPFFFIHSSNYIISALKSEGFEGARFTLVTGVANEEKLRYILRIQDEYPQLKTIVLEVEDKDWRNVLVCWKSSYKILSAAESELESGNYDMLVYMDTDFVFFWHSFPGSRYLWPRQFEMGIHGITRRGHRFRPAKLSFRKYIERWIQHIIMCRAISSGAFRKVAFLDHWAADQARKKWGDRITNAIEPVHIRAMDQRTARKQLGLPENIRIGLLFGSIDRRKGVLAILDIMRQASQPIDDFLLLIAGPVSPAIQEELHTRISELRSRWKIELRDQYIEQDMSAYYSSADCVISTYINFTTSSSVVVHAACCGKPSLVSPEGAMEDTIRQWEIGAVANLNRPGEYLATLEALLNMPETERLALEQRAKSFADTMKAHRFMDQFR